MFGSDFSRAEVWLWLELAAACLVQIIYNEQNMNIGMLQLSVVQRCTGLLADGAARRPQGPEQERAEVAAGGSAWSPQGLRLKRNSEDFSTKVLIFLMPARRIELRTY